MKKKDWYLLSGFAASLIAFFIPITYINLYPGSIYIWCILGIIFTILLVTAIVLFKKAMLKRSLIFLSISLILISAFAIVVLIHKYL